MNPPNPFLRLLESGRETSELDLKRLFWKLAKKYHPDAAGLEKNQDKFIRLKDDFDEARRTMARPRKRPPAPRPASRPDREKCRALFSELVAGNFPMDKKAKETNRIYRERIADLNAELGKFGREYEGLFLKAEQELYEIRGTTTVSNHIFNLVKIYFTNMSAYFDTKNYFSRSYIKKSYGLVMDCLREKKAAAVMKLIDRLIADGR